MESSWGFICLQNIFSREQKIKKQKSYLATQRLNGFLKNVSLLWLAHTIPFLNKLSSLNLLQRSTAYNSKLGSTNVDHGAHKSINSLK